MKRRDFLKTAAGAAAVAGSSTVTAALTGCAPDSSRDTPFTLWTWVHGNRDYDADEWRRRFASLRESGFHAVLVGGGDIELVSAAAHAEGIEYHRWFWTMNRNGDAWAQENHPEWFTVSRNLESSLEKPPYVGYYKWVCPSRAPVRQYLSGRVGELAANPAVDGVHLDYVRHCDVILPRGLWETYDLVQDDEHPEFDFCYCGVCRDRFAALDGRDPLEIPDPPSDEAWRRFRWDSVTGAVRELAAAVHQQEKPITAAVFPTPEIARTLVRQAWDEWPLDRFFPMLYHSFYLEDVAWIGDGVREGVAALAGGDVADGTQEGVAAAEGGPVESGPRPGTPLNAGLYLPVLEPAQLALAVATAREAGAAGASTFEMHGLTDEHLAALRAVPG